MTTETTELTRDEQMKLAMRVMADQPARDLEAGRKWLQSQRRIIIIREDRNDH